MQSHLKKYKLSLSDLTYEEKRQIHIEIRASRLIPKQLPKPKKKPSKKSASKAKTPEAKRVDKITSLIPDLNQEEVDRMLEELKRKKEGLK